MKSDHKVHKYRRINLGKKGYVVYKCMLPNCPHFIRAELCIGRMSICWRCGKEFVMNEKTLQLVKVHCIECTKSKLESKLDALMVKTNE